MNIDKLPHTVIRGEVFYELPEIVPDDPCAGCSAHNHETGERYELCAAIGPCNLRVFVRPADLDRYKSLAVFQKLRV